VSFFNISPALVIVIAALAGLMTGVGGDSA
jgi:hypothetical protein